MIKYIGKPYSFRNYNCWTHACAVRADNGIKTAPFNPKDLRGAFELITEKMKGWDHGLWEVESPKNYDIVIVTKSTSGRQIHHCGVFYDNKITHCCRTRKQVVLDSYEKFIKDYQGVTFWR